MKPLVPSILDKLGSARATVRNAWHNSIASRRALPTVAITGSVGKTTTCRMIAAILSHSGKTVARSGTQGAWIGPDLVESGDVSSGQMALRLLLDPRTEAGVFEIARGGLLKRGMVLNSVDVGAVLNIHDNHLGLDGVKTREEMARVKRVVIERASRLAVLNADDPLCLAMRPFVRAPGHCLVTVRSNNAAVSRHQENGGLVASFDRAAPTPELELHEGTVLIGRIPGREIPAAMEGKYFPALSNALFAMACAHGLGIPFELIRDGLCNFRSTFEDNPGRMNFARNLPFEVCITWADGPAPVREVTGFIAGLEVRGSKRLMLTAMGNRPDSFIQDMASAAAGTYTDYICTDWENLRGRAAMETARILAAGLRQAGIPDDRVTVAPDHAKALDLALARSKPGDLTVLITFSGEKAWARVQHFAATAAQA